MSVTKQSVDRALVEQSSLGVCIDQTRHALHVCDLLEALADDLPKRAAPHWREAQIQARSVLAPYFRWMHDIVLPELERRQSGQDVGHADVLARLTSDCGDQIHTLVDLDDLISDALLCDKFSNEPEALGYALRGHFVSLRRDLSWQLDVLWPLATRICSRADTDRFAEGLQRKTVPI